MRAPLSGPSSATSATSPWHDLFRRLRRGVEYTHVKMICLDVPSGLDVMPWLGLPSNDPIWALFRGKTFRALDRALLRLEGQLAQSGVEIADAAKQHVAMLRYLFVQHALQAIRRIDPEANNRRLEIRLVNPPAEADWERERERRGLVLEVWEPSDPEPRLLDRVVMPAAPSPWGKPEVDYYDMVLGNQLTADVVRRHFPEVLRSRIGQGFRSERAPTGWPMLTQHAILALYDYLRPFYSVRPYRKALRTLTRGDYPTELLEDITDILRLELPHLATALTVEQVQAAVQRYLACARPDRPMGADMFRVWPRTKTP
jgi:hypothetical protein